MNQMPTIPPQVTDLLPTTDRREPAILFEDGRWVVAGRYAIILADPGSHATSGQDEDGVERTASVIDSGMWYEVQTARWDGDSRTLTCTWVDPERPTLSGVTVSEDPEIFMRVVTERVHHTMVTSKQVKAHNGTTLTCWIRRREDNELFSILTADGPLDESGLELASRFEAQMREGVGLD
ncbi:hypothetical protein [Schaalia vaccimaxillae]|uniref:hypothetical protein n=1 Tax=Schaalia vaccimaxillae TaxID=183916 RepID=UPI00041A974A|nr:hypothetical protein [Schaalia vaccimaxillae]